MEAEAFVGAEAIRHEAYLDVMGVSEEGRGGRLVTAEWPQSPRVSLNLSKTSTQ